MSTSTGFRVYNPAQLMLLPPDLRSWLPKGHPTYFILDIVGQLDLSAIYETYDGSQGGQPPYDPRMMVSLLLYGYCEGIRSSRKIESLQRPSGGLFGNQPPTQYQGAGHMPAPVSLSLFRVPITRPAHLRPLRLKHLNDVRQPGHQIG